MTPHCVGRCHAVTEGTGDCWENPFSKGFSSIIIRKASVRAFPLNAVPFLMWDYDFYNSSPKGTHIIPHSELRIPHFQKGASYVS